MTRVLWMLAVCLAVAAVTGCDPFETEIKLNADGTGTVAYRGRLSPGARLLVRDGLRRSSPLRAVFARDAVQEWNAANAAATGVKVLAAEEALEEDKRVSLRVEAAFESLEKASQTPWGFLLQAGVEEEDGKLLLQFDDPVRAAINRLALREFRSEGARSGRRQSEYAALMEALAAGLGGQKSRVVFRLPAPALEVEGATLSADKMTVTLESVAPEGEAGVTAWLARRPAVITLPPEFAGLKLFATPAGLSERGTAAAVTRALPTPAPATAKAAEEFRFRLMSLSISSNRNINLLEGDLEPQQNENFSLQMQFYGPEQANLVRPMMRGGEDPGICVITTARDSEGNDLRNADVRSYFNLYGGFGESYRRNRDQPMGNLQLGLAVPPKGVKSIAKLRGYVNLLQIAEEGKVEIKPLKDNLEKEYVLGEQTIKFLSIKGTSVQYVVTVGESPINLRFYTAEGKELHSGGYSSSGSGDGRMTYTRSTNEPIGDGGYVIVRYPLKTQQLRVPFSFDNIPVP